MIGIEPVVGHFLDLALGKGADHNPVQIAGEHADGVLAVSSPRPIWRSLEDKNSAIPPSSYIPTSNDTRVRVDDLRKIIPSVLPARCGWGMPFLLSYLSWSARLSSSMISSARQVAEPE